MPTETEPGDSLSAQTVHGQRTTLFSHAVRVLCKVISVLVLARLVEPTEHGLYAMAASLTLLLTIFRDLGLGVAALQTPQLSEGERTSLWWTHIAMGTTLTIATIALIPAIVWFYGEPQLAPLVALMSVSFFFMAISAWPRVLLMRELRFAAVNRAETTAVVLATVAMIAAGACGLGAYAFAIFLLVVEAVTAIGAWRACAWRPQGRPKWRHVQPLLRTGFDITGYNCLLHLSQQLDTLLVGRWFGPRNLGFYFRSSQLLQLPALHITTPLAQVMLASLSRQGVAAPQLREQVRSTANLVLHLTLPLTVLCAVLPREMTFLILGRDWLDATPFLRWMGFNAAFTAMTATAYGLSVATGNTRRLAGLASISLLANLVALALARQFGPANVALALAGANFITLVPRLWWVSRSTPVELRDFGSAFCGPVAVAIAFALGLAGGALMAPMAAEALRMIGGTAGGMVAVGLLCAVWERPRGELRKVWAYRPRGRMLFAADSVSNSP